MKANSIETYFDYKDYLEAKGNHQHNPFLDKKEYAISCSEKICEIIDEDEARVSIYETYTSKGRFRSKNLRNELFDLGYYKKESHILRIVKLLKKLGIQQSDKIDLFCLGADLLYQEKQGVFMIWNGSNWSTKGREFGKWFEKKS